MKNIEKYKDNIESNINVCGLYYEIYKIKIGKSTSDCCCNCDKCYDDCIRWLAEEFKEPVLDEVERKYLSDVIKPFRNRVTAVTKYKSCTWVTGKQFICIQLLGEECSEFINLPWFKSNTMYKGMELNKGYTLKELGL